MNKICNTFIYIGFAINSTVAISASTDEPQMDMSVSHHDRSLVSTRTSQNASFIPLEGVYDKSKVYYEDLCLDEDNAIFVERIMNIIDVNVENSTFTLRWTTPSDSGFSDTVSDMFCEYHGLFFKCETPNDVTDFAIFGKDAIVTTEDSGYGVWGGVNTSVYLTLQSTLSCEGPDCLVEPVSSMYGNLNKAMPCSQTIVRKYDWQSAITSYADVHLILNAVDTDNQGNLETHNLATEAIVDTDERFEAILFDFQSQETLANLVWDNSEGSGKITFDADGISEEVSLDIANVENIPSSERYTILLQGLHEAGVAWLSSQSGAPTSESTSEAQQLSVQVDHVTDGAINSRSQNSVSVTYSGDENTTPYAEGWAYNPEDPGKSVWIHLYAKPDSQSTYKYVGTVYANQESPDVNSTMNISGDHGFEVEIPTDWSTGE